MAACGWWLLHWTASITTEGSTGRHRSRRTGKSHGQAAAQGSAFEKPPEQDTQGAAGTGRGNKQGSRRSTLKVGGGFSNTRRAFQLEERLWEMQRAWEKGERKGWRGTWASEQDPNGRWAVGPWGCAWLSCTGCELAGPLHQ